jgi:hypothetical protein
LTPKFGEPGVLDVAAEEEPPEAVADEVAEALLLELPEEEHPAAASTRAVAEKTARTAGLRIFMCGSFRHQRKKGRLGLAGMVVRRMQRGSGQGLAVRKSFSSLN